MKIKKYPQSCLMIESNNKKIDDDFDVKLIQTVRGIGYMLTEPD